jgi:hypothetical protein
MYAVMLMYNVVNAIAGDIIRAREVDNPRVKFIFYVF